MMTAIETYRRGLERHFLVFDMSDRLVGILEEEDILKAMQKPDSTAEIARYAQAAEYVRADDSMLKVHYLVRQRGLGIVPVVDEQGQILGVIDEAGLTHFVRLSAN
jgi:Mg/Co/Ni transporter MgtE